MPATHHIDSSSRLLITTWEGEAVDIDFIEAIKKYQQDIQSNSDYHHFNEIVDLTKITGIKLTTNGIKHISSIASSTDQNRASTKLALIVSSNLAFGLARMYEAYRSMSKDGHKEIRVFKNKNEAFVWINGKI
jgi:hypothetical protein